jgi:hypothetical protein
MTIKTAKELFAHVAKNSRIHSCAGGYEFDAGYNRALIEVEPIVRELERRVETLKGINRRYRDEAAGRRKPRGDK